MYLTPNSQNVYSCRLEWISGGRRSLITSHWAAVIPGSTADQPSAVCTRALDSYLPFIAGMSGNDLGVVTALATPVAMRSDAFAAASSSPFIGARSIVTAAPEASFIIRRVGAGPVGNVKGRCRIGPLDNSAFTDPPRYRTINTLNPFLISQLAILNAQQLGALGGLYEVLWNRITWVATVIGNYNIAKWTGRVWARAGYPQGKRGPDRS